LEKSRKILLIAPRYFDYDTIIKAYLEKKGFIVDLINDRPYDSNILKAIVRVNRSLIYFFLYFYYKAEILKKYNRKYDLILVIQGEGLVPMFLKWLRKKYQTTPMINYLWDSVANKPKLQDNFPCFDRVITFDLRDAKKLGIDFYPLFFSPGFDNIKTTKYTYDLAFIGSLHGDRAFLISSLKKSMPNLNYFIYIYSPSRWIFFIRRIFNRNFFKINSSYLHFERLPLEEVKKILLQSEIVLDFHDMNQSGLTMRTIEALALKKKIVTTNSNVKEYDFYNSKNIFILDRNCPAIPASFIASPYKPINKKIIIRYSLDAFYQNVIQRYIKS
jgi:hypothetical protein